MTWYCGKECQDKDWQNHKGECKKTRIEYMTSTIEKCFVGAYDKNEIPPCNAGIPSSKCHCAVKVQTNMAVKDGHLLVYNKDYSICGNLHREGQEKNYDMLVMAINEKGYNGLKGFFHAIFNPEEFGQENVRYLKVKINPLKMLPLDTW